MYRAIILPFCFYSLTVMAGTSESGCPLGIQKLTPNTLAFFYKSQAKTAIPYFYVKAMSEGKLREKSLESIMAKGENLLSVQNTPPSLPGPYTY